MQAKGLLFLWGVLASCLVFSADGSAIPSYDEIAAKFKESRFLDTVHLEEPTEQEWIEIITETLQGHSLPKYLADKNYTFHVNETGEFSDTEGVKGSWNSTTYVLYQFTEGQTMRYMLHLKSEEVGTHRFETGSLLLSMVTFLKQGYVTAHALNGESFVNNDNVLLKIGNFLGFGQGQGEIMDADNLQFVNSGMMVVNRSAVFSVCEVEYGGLITAEIDKNIYHLDAGLFKNSIPLSTVDVASLPKNPEALASLLRATKASTPHIAVSLGTVRGEQTFGEAGSYKGDMEAVTRVYPDRTFNTTATVKATFDSKQTDAHLLIQDLIDINNPFLG